MRYSLFALAAFGAFSAALAVHAQTQYPTRPVRVLVLVQPGGAADLVARTSRAADQGRWENTMRFWAGPQVLIVDELGYLPMAGEAGSHLFQVITRRYLHGTVILTTNRGIAEWGAIFEDTTVAVAILDRLLHYATVLSTKGTQAHIA